MSLNLFRVSKEIHIVKFLPCPPRWPYTDHCIDLHFFTCWINLFYHCMQYLDCMNACVHARVRKMASQQIAYTNSWSLTQFSPLTDWVIRSSSSLFWQEAIMSSSSMGWDIHFLMLSIRHFLCQLQCRLPSKVPWRVVLERLLWCVTCLNGLSFCSFDACQKRFLWVHKDLALAP